ELASDKGVKAATLIKSFTEILPKGIDYTLADTLFKEGKAAIIMNGPWSIADYQKAGIDIGLATIPVVSNSGQPGKPFVDVDLWMLATEAKNPQAAVDLMKYYTSADVQAELTRLYEQIPANKSVQNKFKDDPIIAGFLNQVDRSEPLPNTVFTDA